MKKLTHKHTPGPWGIEDQFHKGQLTGLAIHNPHFYFEGTVDENTRADALLMAAAPDLLKACEYVVEHHRTNDSGEGELFGLDFVTTCISAIMKAKGE